MVSPLNIVEDSMERERTVPLYLHEREDTDKLLIHEDWYGVLRPIYSHFEKAGTLAEIVEAPSEFESIMEVFGQLVIEAEVQGWVFAFSILSALKMAASRLFEIGKFTYGTQIVENWNSDEDTEEYTTIRELPLH